MTNPLQGLVPELHLPLEVIIEEPMTIQELEQTAREMRSPWAGMIQPQTDEQGNEDARLIPNGLDDVQYDT